MAEHTKVLVIGAGASGIIAAHSLKVRLGVDDFVVVEKTGSVGGTWSEEINNYPGCGVDIPSHFYSFSFNPNPAWSHTYCRHDELAAYMNATVDKFGLRGHIRLGTEVVSAAWTTKTAAGPHPGFWRVVVRDSAGTHTLDADIVVSAVGILSTPKEVALDGLDSFQGRYWHSAAWDTSYDWRGKRVAVVGNGCSATQIIPDMLADGVGSITQFGRSTQWYMPREDPPIPKWQQWAYAHVPLYLTLTRFWHYYKVDAESITLETSARARPWVEKLAAKGIAHIKATAPPHLADSLIPDSVVGCKRRVMDGTNKGSYLAALSNPRLRLVPSRAVRADATGVVAADGSRADADAVVFCTGYTPTEYLVPMEIRGVGGKSLREVWAADEGAHAYATTSVAGFPNFALVFGPNSLPSNNSCIFKAECGVEFIERVLFRPLLVEQSARVIDVRREADVRWTADIRHRLSSMVWSSGCANWYLNKWGHNSTNFPGSGMAYRRMLVTTTLADYDVQGTNGWWGVYRALDFVTYWPWAMALNMLLLLVDALEKRFPLL
ncbi:hypothetical protein Q8F55_003223 [Vanrija albida]|uniref:Monooxygenase n=1 Tax=Vanrija albida TaxID=181172 RepID=A0ABR3QC20_9TREE